jgi:hypothetical protein
MKRYFLLGLAALGLIALAPTESKADDGFRVYVNPGYQDTDITTMVMTDTAIIDMRTNTACTNGAGTIIGTITIGIMTGTTTGIDASCLFLRS